jgi:hypothetical protein
MFIASTWETVDCMLSANSAQLEFFIISAL